MTASYINVPVPTESFLELVDALRERGSSQDPVKVIDRAISIFIQNLEIAEDDLLWRHEKNGIEKVNSSVGYVWKKYFLPAGSILRMKYKGRFYDALVEGNNIIYEGENTSPSGFVNKVAQGTTRNAWRDLMIKRPKDTGFQPAKSLSIKRQDEKMS